MSEQATTETPEKTDPTAGKEHTFTQADVDRIIAERLKRENISELKSAAAELAALRESTKSEDDKVKDRIAKLEQATVVAQTEALRLRVATKHGISEEDADLFLTGTDAATLEKQATRLVDRVAAAKKNGNVVPNEGKTPPAAKTNDMREFTRELFGSVAD